MKENEDWGQKFGNIFIGMLGMFFVMAMIMLFIGCEITLKTEEVKQPEKEKKTEKDSTKTADYFNPDDWIMFSPY